MVKHCIGVNLPYVACVRRAARRSCRATASGHCQSSALVSRRRSLARGARHGPLPCASGGADTRHSTHCTRGLGVGGGPCGTATGGAPRVPDLKPDDTETRIRNVLPPLPVRSRLPVRPLATAPRVARHRVPRHRTSTYLTKIRGTIYTARPVDSTPVVRLGSRCPNTTYITEQRARPTATRGHTRSAARLALARCESHAPEPQHAMAGPGPILPASPQMRATRGGRLIVRCCHAPHHHRRRRQV